MKPLGYGLVDMSGHLIMDRLPNVSGHLKDGFLVNKTFELSLITIHAKVYLVYNPGCHHCSTSSTCPRLPIWDPCEPFDWELPEAEESAVSIYSISLLRLPLTFPRFENKIEPGDHTGYRLSYLASLWLSSFLNNKTKPQGCRVSFKCTFLVIEQVPTPWDGREFYPLYFVRR